MDLGMRAQVLPRGHLRIPARGLRGGRHFCHERSGGGESAAHFHIDLNLGTLHFARPRTNALARGSRPASRRSPYAAPR